MFEVENKLKTALIDADGLIYIVAYCKQKRDENGMPLLNDLGHPDKEEKTLEQCQDAIDDIIKNIMLATDSDEYLLFLTIGKNFRYDVYPEYKANRKNLEKPKHFDEIKKYLITKHNAVSHKDLEADDLCLIYRGKIEGSFICSPDKDMLGLEGTHYNYTKGGWLTVSKDEAERNFWFSMITGDTADNIKGIPGKGIKYAEGLFDECSDIQGAETQIGVFRNEILSNYIDKFGEEQGIYEFYKNYKVLKIRDKYDITTYRIPNKFNVERNNEQTERDPWI